MSLNILLTYELVNASDEVEQAFTEALTAKKFLPVPNLSTAWYFKSAKHKEEAARLESARLVYDAAENASADLQFALCASKEGIELFDILSNHEDHEGEEDDDADDENETEKEQEE